MAGVSSVPRATANDAVPSSRTDIANSVAPSVAGVTSPYPIVEAVTSVK